MTHETSPSPESVLARYIAQRDRGEQPSLERWIEAQPELAGQDALADQVRALYVELGEPLAGLEDRLGSLWFHRRSPTPQGESQRFDRLRPGKLIADFELVRPIGRGGMGEVWEAEQKSLGRRVALKFLLPEGATERGAELFSREARAAGRLAHAHIVQTYASGTEGSHAWLAQELIEGSWTLRDSLDELQASDPLPRGYFRATGELVAKLCDALGAAHSAGVIHRDIKPQNILISPDDEPLLTDFGLARLTDESGLSKSGDLAGTFAYMSPEQVRGERRGLDHRSDVFSLGVVLYELLTLHRPFEGESHQDVCQKILSVDPPDPRRLRLQVPRDLAIIVGKALEKAPSDRYASMADFGADLRRYLANESIRARPPKIGVRTIKWIQRHSIATSIAVALLMAAGITLWFAAGKARETRARLNAKRDELYARAQWSCDTNDFERARSLIAEAQALDPQDPKGHLILAHGLAQFSRTQESEDEIRRAIALGFDPEADTQSAPIDHVAHGLYLLAARDPDRVERAKEHLETALAADPTLRGAYFVLYQIHVGERNDAEALANLDALRQHLAAGNPFLTVVDALIDELSGSHVEAAERLKSLAERPDIDADKLDELRVDRHLGRLYVRLGEFDRAEHHLQRAVSSLPHDCWSWNSLAALSLARYQEDEDQDRWRLEMKEYAERAVACNRTLLDSLLMIAHASIEGFGKAQGEEHYEETDLWKDARADLDRLKDSDLDPAKVAPLEAQLAYYEGMHPFRRHDFAEAAQRFEEACTHSATALRPLTLLGQCHWYLGENQQGLASLDRALELWDSAEGSWKEEWLGRILTWAYGHSIALGREEQVRTLRGRILEVLRERRALQKEELVTLAEFLALPTDPRFQDCALALEALGAPGLEESFQGDPQERAALELIRRIEASCR